MARTKFRCSTCNKALGLSEAVIGFASLDPKKRQMCLSCARKTYQILAKDKEIIWNDAYDLGYASGFDAGYLKDRDEREEQARISNSGRKLYQLGFKDGKKEATQETVEKIKKRIEDDVIGIFNGKGLSVKEQRSRLDKITEELLSELKSTNGKRT